MPNAFTDHPSAGAGKLNFGTPPGCVVADEEAAMSAASYEAMLQPFRSFVKGQGDLQSTSNSEEDRFEMPFCNLLAPPAQHEIVAFARDKDLVAEFVGMGVCATQSDDGQSSPIEHLCILHLRPTRITAHGRGPDIGSARHSALVSAVHYLANVRPWISKAA